MTKIYTRTGDHGDTGYLGKGRIRKDSPRIQALGALDEANSALGVALSLSDVPDPIRDLLGRVQSDLFEAGAAAASAEPAYSAELLDEETAWLESRIDELERGMPPLDRFILPGGSPAGAQFHWARTVCRRAEREVVAAFHEEPERGALLRFVNRLSDALFVIARATNASNSRPEDPWVSRKSARPGAEES